MPCTYTVLATHAISAHPEYVWAALTDLDEAASTLPGVIGSERLDGPAYDVGTRWRETRLVFGRPVSEVMEVTACTPGRAATVRAVSRGVIYTTEFRIAAAGGLTLLTMSLTGEQLNPTVGSRIIHALTAPLAKSMTRTAMQKDLAAIGAAAQRRSR